MRYLHALILGMTLCAAASAQHVPGIQLELEPYATGFSEPLDIQYAGDDRLFVVEKGGMIRILDADGTVLDPPFLNITDRVQSSGSEQGLLGLAFHPDYASNGYFFVNYTFGQGTTRIARYTRDPENPDLARRDSEKVILEVSQPFHNHNGGALAFGPDGYLYIALGDGGNAGDPEENGQDRQALLGKLLRIDIDVPEDEAYAIPESNPFRTTDETLDEIWALGLRNPWRFSFDRLTGDLWIGDVGQDAYEEVNFQHHSSVGGENYGWDCYEGFEPFELAGCPPADDLVMPVYAYPHAENDRCYSVTGGRVYRGEAIPALQGVYLFADLCDGILRGLLPTVEGDFLQTDLSGPSDFGLVAFGEDQAGELLLANLSNGIVYRLVDACAAFDPPMISVDEGTLSVTDTFATYQWRLDDEPIEGATGPSLQAPASGSVTVTATTEGGCALTSEPYILTSLEQALGIRSLRVHPNPFTDQFSVRIHWDAPQPLRLLLTDMQGRRIEERVISPSNSIEAFFSTSGLPAGTYLLRVEAGQGRVMRRLIKR